MTVTGVCLKYSIHMIRLMGRWIHCLWGSNSPINLSNLLPRHKCEILMPSSEMGYSLPSYSPLTLPIQNLGVLYGGIYIFLCQRTCFLLACLEIPFPVIPAEPDTWKPHFNGPGPSDNKKVTTLKSQKNFVIQLYMGPFAHWHRFYICCCNLQPTTVAASEALTRTREH